MSRVHDREYEPLKPAETKSLRAELLDEANSLVNGDRNNQYGPPWADFERTAGIWSALGVTIDGQPVEGHHVAMLMVGLKLSRLVWSPNRRDSWTDIAGYSACGWEVAEHEHAVRDVASELTKDGDG